jgi:hypothetical protein
MRPIDNSEVGRRKVASARKRGVRLYLRADEIGHMVFDSLSKGPKTRIEIEADVGLDGNRVRRGLTYIRQILADERTQPLAYDPRTRIWTLTDTWPEQRKDARWQARYMNKRIRSVEKMLRVARARYGDKVPSTLVRQAERLREDLHDYELEVARNS